MFLTDLIGISPVFRKHATLHIIRTFSLINTENCSSNLKMITFYNTVMPCAKTGNWGSRDSQFSANQSGLL